MSGPVGKNSENMKKFIKLWQATSFTLINCNIIILYANIMNRSKEQLLADILVASNEPNTKTLIMYRARLSYAQLLTYMKFLEKKQMIQKTENGKWAITDKGKDYLNYFEKITTLLKCEEQPTIKDERHIEIK